MNGLEENKSMSNFNAVLKYAKRYGLGITVKTSMRKLGIGEQDILAANIPFMKKCEKMSKAEYPMALCEWYERSFGKELHLDNPKTFTEKIQWMKLYDTTPLKTELSDKYLAPKYVKEKCGNILEIVPQYGVWDNPEQIDFKALPEKYVLKCNHGCGMNIIVDNKEKLDIEKTKKLLDHWMKINYAYILGDFELQYADIPRKIIAEKYIEEMDGNLHDYKIHCFNGIPKIIQVNGDRDFAKNMAKQAFYDYKWKKLEEKTGAYPVYEEELERPKSLESMLEAARVLATPFSYVRVDLYEIDGKSYFGELTFTPRGGYYPDFSPADTDRKWGDMIQLPEKENRDKGKI
jgi:hypothetical protein